MTPPENPLFKIERNKTPIYLLCVVNILLAGVLFIPDFFSGFISQLPAEPTDRIIVLSGATLFWAITMACFISALFSTKYVLEFYDDRILYNRTFWPKKYEFPINRVVSTSYSNNGKQGSLFFRLVYAKKEMPKTKKDLEIHAFYVWIKTEYKDIDTFLRNFAGKLQWKHDEKDINP